jgi:hypothetical protein
MSKVFPRIMSKVDKRKPVCNACKYREFEPFYGEKADLTSLFPDLDSPTMDDFSRVEGNSDLHNGSHEQQHSKMEALIGGWVPQSKEKEVTTESIPS